MSNYFNVNYVSFSRLDSYLKCPQYFDYKYSQNIEYAEPFNQHLFLGKAVHTILENVLSGNSAQEIFNKSVPGWLGELGVPLDPTIVEKVITTSEKLGNLLYRCSTFCSEKEEQIRNKDNTLLKDPINFPSKQLQIELNNQNLKIEMSRLDNLIIGYNSQLLTIPISWIFGEIYHLGTGFKLPAWLSNTKHIELGFSTCEENAALIRGFTDLYFRGYIDWIAELKDGRIAILDHKTSSKPPSKTDVIHHPQLNLYAHYYKEVYGLSVDIIGIHHVKTGKYIMSELDTEIMNSTVNHFSELAAASYQNKVIKHRPTDYNSPCITRDWKSQEIKYCCPFMEKCWGVYYNLIKCAP